MKRTKDRVLFGSWIRTIGVVTGILSSQLGIVVGPAFAFIF